MFFTNVNAFANCRFGTNTTAGTPASIANTKPLFAVGTRRKFPSRETSGQNGSHSGANNIHESKSSCMPFIIEGIGQASEVVVCISLEVLIQHPQGLSIGALRLRSRASHDVPQEHRHIVVLPHLHFPSRLKAPLRVALQCH